MSCHTNSRGENLIVDFSVVIPADPHRVPEVVDDVTRILAANGWPEGPNTGTSLPAGSVMGFNVQKKPVYFGPGAPAGPRYHHYVWEVYALNANLDLPPDSTREAVYAAMAGKVVGKAIYVGRYRGEPK